jgi:dTDP-glucose 4,6-dehydratase
MNALAGRELPVYGDGLYVRDWLYVLDHCRAADLVLRRGRPGEAYNIGGDSERSNLDLLHALLALVARRNGRPLDGLRGLVRHVRDRPGHDRRYAIDAGKLTAELGWRPTLGLEQGLALTVDWYLDHQDWCAGVASGAYRDYYRRMYDGR